MKIFQMLFAASLMLYTARLVHAEEPKSADVAAALKRSADWQLANPSGAETRFWTIAPLYDGLIRLGGNDG
jgi:hypothetical protein